MKHEHPMKESNYKMLGGMIAIHFIFMFFLMYSMTNSLGEVYLNTNNLYMTGLMVAPMGVTMLLMMPSMYKIKKLNLLWSIGSIFVFGVFWVFMRTQAFVGDKQFVRAMIPHHSGALLMCEEASLKDSELVTLCQQIINGQKQEIDQMKKILERL